VVVLHHTVGLPLTEVAQILGLPYGTVGSRLHYAMRHLREVLESDAAMATAEGRPA
jgi:DNA-directed RNA polymerase specialized sigma24 family protein